MHAQRIFVLSALLVAGIAQAQFAIRQVAKSGQAIPTIPSETFDDVRQNTCHPIVLDDGKVIFHTPYSGFGSILAEWDRFSFKDIMKPNDTPPPLPPDFTNAQGNPHSDPSIKAPAFSALVGMDYSWYISVRIGDFNVSGTKRGYFYQPLSGGIINTSPQYFGETDISSGGIATRSSDIFRTGYTPVDFDAFIAKESYSGLSRVLFQQNQQAYDLPLGVTYNNVLGANIDWTPLGRLHFLGTVTGTGITFSNNTVLCREEPLGLTVGIVAQSGTQHPAEPGLAAGGTFGYLSTYSLNAVGDLAFNVTITDPANTASTVGSIWYADEQDNLSLVVRQGGTYPVLGLGPAITFNFPGRAVITSNGDIVFPASWNDGGFRYGFFRWLKSTGNIQIEIQDGDPITGFGGLTGISFSNTGNEFCVSKTGRIAAECSVTIGGNTRLALVVQKPDASFQAAAIVGESISITGGDFLGTVATAELPGQAFSNGENRIPSPFSPTGRLVFFCTTSSDEALLAADVDFEPYNPLPVSAPAGRATLWDAPSRTISGLEIELQSVQTNLPGLASLTKPFDLEALTGLSSKQIRDLRGLEMFSDDAVEFAKTYMVARDNLLRVIEAIIPQDPQLAAWLLDSFRNGRISFGNAKSKKIKAFAQIFADADPACGTEPITLFFIPGEPLERYSDDFVQLMNTLMHEARHAFQSFPSIFTANTPIKKAEWALNRHQNELVASCEELERIDDLERAQAGLSSSNWARDTIAEMRADLTGQALADAEKELRARLRKMKRNAAETKECREDYIEAYERFLAGGIATSNAVTTLYTELGQNKWFRKFRNTTTAFGEIVVSGGGASYNSGSGQMDGNTSVRQLNTETGTETSFVPGTSPDYLQGRRPEQRSGDSVCRSERKREVTGLRIHRLRQRRIVRQEHRIPHRRIPRCHNRV